MSPSPLEPQPGARAESRDAEVHSHDLDATAARTPHGADTKGRYLAPDALKPNGRERSVQQLPSPSPSPEPSPSRSPPQQLETWPDMPASGGDNPAQQLQDIPEEPATHRHRHNSSVSGNPPGEVLKLSSAEMQELTSEAESLPMTSPKKDAAPHIPALAGSPMLDVGQTPDLSLEETRRVAGAHLNTASDRVDPVESTDDGRSGAETRFSGGVHRRPRFSSRAASSPVTGIDTRTPVYNKKPPTSSASQGAANDLPPSPEPQSIPIPPMSIPTHLQLELAASRPSPLYIHRSTTGDIPYESTQVKYERLLNFLLLPPHLEQVLFFGALACLDAWLYTFTILPLRFCSAASILIQWFGQSISTEVRFIMGYIYHGSGRMWHRSRGRGVSDAASQSRSESRDSRSLSRPRQDSSPMRASVSTSYQESTARRRELSTSDQRGRPIIDMRQPPKRKWGRHHRRQKSQPSLLSSNHKADLLQGAVIVCSCLILLKFDASRMYHSIRGQTDVKLYVIFNLLEVADKLFSALGQDIYECLFADETLARDDYGRSKIVRPLGMFFLALAYNVIHSTGLFYQVIALNVAVNSYSNALVTLLMSNQFVEVKGAVFKKFEKDNLFQLTCADIVERFQLWLILMIIMFRNIVEVGGISVFSFSSSDATDAIHNNTVPLRTYSMLPNSFTILPNWSFEVLSPFIVVLGSEVLVDWIKHAYINKFNNVKPAVYDRYLDVLAKDYYKNAFYNQNLIKRLGLPVIPLSCLFIRSSIQTYNMFLAAHMPAPISSTATALSVESATSSPVFLSLAHFDSVIRHALGRSTFGVPDPTATVRWYLPSADALIASLTMLTVFLAAFMVLLVCKLVLGMILLKFARNRYAGMKRRERADYDTGGKRVGGWGMIEVDDEKKRWIFDGDQETLRKLKEKERAARERAERGGVSADFSRISRYSMSAKRIW